MAPVKIGCMAPVKIGASGDWRWRFQPGFSLLKCPEILHFIFRRTLRPWRKKICRVLRRILRRVLCRVFRRVLRRVLHCVLRRPIFAALFAASPHSAPSSLRHHFFSFCAMRSSHNHSPRARTFCEQTQQKLEHIHPTSSSPCFAQSKSVNIAANLQAKAASIAATQTASGTRPCQTSRLLGPATAAVPNTFISWGATQAPQSLTGNAIRPRKSKGMCVGKHET